DEVDQRQLGTAGVGVHEAGVEGVDDDEGRIECCGAGDLGPVEDVGDHGTQGCPGGVTQLWTPGRPVGVVARRAGSGRCRPRGRPRPPGEPGLVSHRGGAVFVIAAITDTSYKVVLVLHIIAVVVGFAPAIAAVVAPRAVASDRAAVRIGRIVHTPALI